ncbi:MAG: hypothetical protein IT323_11295 [Anaerolineae bacterium]|nr:hypothetical protein [Anaerolineae bacterium]
MSRTNFLVDKRDSASVDALLDAFGARGTEYEAAIREALGLHERSFVLYIDHLNRPDVSPLDDPFTFNIETGELALFAEEPHVLLDAILEMAMFVRGFDTLLEDGDEWEIQIAIGAWRHVRQNLLEQFALETEVHWRVAIDPSSVERYTMGTFSTAIYLAARPNLDVDFPPGCDAQVIEAYQRVSRMLQAVALDIELGDQAKFNRRLRRTVAWIDQSLRPADEPSPFDDLFGPDGFDDAFFDDEPDSNSL